MITTLENNETILEKRVHLLQDLLQGVSQDVKNAILYMGRSPRSGARGTHKQRDKNDVKVTKGKETEKKDKK